MRKQASLAVDAVTPNISTPHDHQDSRVIKRLFDLTLASILLVLLSPFLLLVTLLVAVAGVPPIFGHSRIGRHGKPFQCFKFRTMVINADDVLNRHLANNMEARAEWQRDQKLKNDPRVTFIGNILRRTSLDELPQLWNVVKGDMSLVGPRPVVYEELKRYKDNLPYYLAVRPGITGLWQVSGRNDLDYDDRVNLDAWYVRNRTMLMDVSLLFKTAFVLVNQKGAY